MSASNKTNLHVNNAIDSGLVNSEGKNSVPTNVITPGKHSSTLSVDQKMMVEKDIIEELLLVCGVIGTTTGDGDEIVPVTDCLNWLQDLQRALRRDDDHFRPISLLMGKWKLVEQKLLPLVLTSRYDSMIVLTVVKILVILTKPLAESTKTAGKLIIDTSNKADPVIVSHQIKLRENALEQARLLVDYKRIIAHHPSHHSEKQGTGLLSIFVSLLAEPLSRSGASRKDSDHLTIELVFHLFRNLLAAEPLLNTSTDASRQSNQLHQELIDLFDKELVLEIILVLAQDIEARENAQYNLLMMELLHHLLKSQDPAMVASSPVTLVDTQNKQISTLAATLKREQSRRLSIARARHGHFGGTWMKQKSDGNATFVSITKPSTCDPSSTSATRKNRKAEPFIGSGKTLLVHSRKASVEQGPATSRANRALNNFCERFIKDCYGPVMKSLKNEFRRDSHRLESGDKVVFFRIVWFFCQWWRLAKPGTCLGQLIFTMDVFTFNLVLFSTDAYQQHKHHTRLAQSVALYSEMMFLLVEMHKSKDDTESIMARGLLDRLFYGSEPLDRLPKLLNRWAPGTSTREYLCDLVEVCHNSLKLLEMNKEESLARVATGQKEKSEKIQRMRVSAAHFDVKGYFVRKLLSNQFISMHIHLLGQYRINSANITHRLLSIFVRLMRTEIATAEAQEAGVASNPLGSQTVILEPLLFNIHLLMTVQRILTDVAISTEENDQKDLILFCTTICHRFWVMTKKNPMLFVECLFRHPTPSKFCELVSNQYVSEELRMLAEREVLLEDQERLREEQAHDLVDQGVDDEDDDENEFDHSTDRSPESSSIPLFRSNDNEGTMLEYQQVNVSAAAPESTTFPEGSGEHCCEVHALKMSQHEAHSDEDSTHVPVGTCDDRCETTVSVGTTEPLLSPLKRDGKSCTLDSRDDDKRARLNSNFRSENA